jgi:hypothetical protein
MDNRLSQHASDLVARSGLGRRSRLGNGALFNAGEGLRQTFDWIIDVTLIHLGMEPADPLGDRSVSLGDILVEA